MLRYGLWSWTSQILFQIQAWLLYYKMITSIKNKEREEGRKAGQGKTNNKSVSWPQQDHD